MKLEKDSWHQLWTLHYQQIVITQLKTISNYTNFPLQDKLQHFQDQRHKQATHIEKRLFLNRPDSDVST